MLVIVGVFVTVAVLVGVGVFVGVVVLVGVLVGLGVSGGVEETVVVEYRDWETDRKSTRLNSSHRL